MWTSHREGLQSRQFGPCCDYYECGSMLNFDIEFDHEDDWRQAERRILAQISKCGVAPKGETGSREQ